MSVYNGPDVFTCQSIVSPPPPLLFRTLRESQPWMSPKVSERYLVAHYPTVGQISPRTRKSMSLDMGQPSQANTKKLLGKKTCQSPPLLAAMPLHNRVLTTREQSVYVLGFVLSDLLTLVEYVRSVVEHDIHFSFFLLRADAQGTRKSFDHLISDTKAPKRPEMESGITTPPKMRRVAENDYEIGECFDWSDIR